MVCDQTQSELDGGFGLRFYLFFLSEALFAVLRRPKNLELPMKARVVVTLRNGILDPQGKAIEGALKSLAIEGIESVRQGKVFDIELAAPDRAAAEGLLREACEKLLANQIVENFAVEIL
jgi:phosphoribosylformylglycinamidine synthase